MAVEAAHLGELGPFVAAGVAGEVVERGAELHDLPHGPGADAVGVARPRGGPVRRHGLGVVVELEGEDGMAGGDQLVVDFLVGVAEVAGEAEPGADA